jgi:integrase
MRAYKGKWYVRFTIDGIEYSQPTGLEASERNQQKAMLIEAKARQMVLDGKADCLKLKSIPFSKAAADFLKWAEGEYGKETGTYKRIKSSFSFLKQHFASRPVLSITPGHLEKFKTIRRDMNVKEVSIRNDLHSLSLFFKYCIKNNWARNNVVRSVSIPSGADAVRMNILTPAQERMYFDACLWMHRAARFIPSRGKDSYQDLYDFGRLMIQQGCRPEELLELRKESVDILNGRMQIVKGKSRAARRRLRLTSESAQILKERMKTKGPWVFPSPENSKVHRGVTWRAHAAVLKAIAHRKGAPDFVHYDLRHTFATRAAADGVPAMTLAAMLGHSNLRSVLCYVHITGADIEAEMLRLEALRSARAGGEKVSVLFPSPVSETGGNDETASGLTRCDAAGETLVTQREQVT